MASKLVGFSDTGVAAKGQYLKASDDHKWYYYPNMTNEEVLVFTQFEEWKGVDNKAPDAKFTSNFHCAFKDPTAPQENAEPRRSCEYRATLWI